ncbi:hypothetical protein GF402_06735 [Candidatus Fermentibacteria bacterium]|nr:hypothetical protein [Candidatus Fermentibacteria bacterium]
MHRVLRRVALIPLFCLASESVAGGGTADLLLIPTPASATEMSMGAAGRALASGPGAVLGNVAGLGSGFSAAGGRWNLQTTSVSASAAFRVGTGAHVGVGLRYLGRGGLVERDQQGAETGEYSFSSGTAGAGLSWRVGEDFAVGGSLGAAWENVADEGGTGLTAGLGIRGRPVENLVAGVLVDGLGQPPSWNGVYKDMPTTVWTGAAYSLSETLTGFGGARIGFNTAAAYGGGARALWGGLSVSAGYDLSAEAEMEGLFGGVGYVYRTTETYLVEVAFSQRAELSWPVMAGLSVWF